MLAIKAMTAMKLTRDDNVPAEIIPGLYLGSVGVAFNKEALQNNKITHILTCADKIQPRFPSVRILCYSLMLIDVCIGLFVHVFANLRHSH